jgi:hypothetical protein
VSTRADWKHHRLVPQHNSAPVTQHVEQSVQLQLEQFVAVGEGFGAIHVEDVGAHRCHYDWRARKVTDIRQGMFYPTRFASPQGWLILWTPSDSLVVYRARAPRHRGARVSSTPQLLLFEVVPTG